MACVYLLEDLNGFGYIGSTINLRIRLTHHKCKRNDCKSKYLTKPFECCVLEQIEDEDNLEFAEQFYIKLYKDLYGDKLLNKKTPLRTDKEWRNDNIDKIKEAKKKHYIENRDKVIKRVKEYSIKNREKVLEKNKKYYTENRDKVLEAHKKHYIENRNKVVEQQKKYRIENIDKVLEGKKKYYTENKDKIIKCECGSTTTIFHKTRHLKTKKHQNFLDAQIKD